MAQKMPRARPCAHIRRAAWREGNRDHTKPIRESPGAERWRIKGWQGRGRSRREAFWFRLVTGGDAGLKALKRETAFPPRSARIRGELGPSGMENGKRGSDGWHYRPLPPSGGLDQVAERPGSGSGSAGHRLFCTIELTNSVIARIESLSVGAQLEDVPEKAPFAAGRGGWSKFLHRERYEVEFRDNLGPTYASVTFRRVQLMGLDHQPNHQAA